MSLRPSPPDSFRKCTKPRFFCRGIGMTSNHALVPFLDRLGGMFGACSLTHSRIASSSSRRLTASSNASGFNFRKAEQMFVEPDGLVVVAVEQTLLVQPRLIDQDEADERIRPTSRTDCADAVCASVPRLKLCRRQRFGPGRRKVRTSGATRVRALMSTVTIRPGSGRPDQ